MIKTYNFKVVDVKFGVSVEGPYSYLARSTNTNVPFEYFLNPAVYGGVSGEVYNSGSGTYIPGASELDDRYTVGTSSRRLVFGGNNASTVVSTTGTPIVDTSAFSLVKVPKTGLIRPYLIIRAYEYRLASYSYYALVYSRSYADLAGDSVFTDANDFINKILNKNFLQGYLFGKLATAIASNGGVADVSAQEFEFAIPSDLGGEFVTGFANGNLTKGSLQDSLLSLITRGSDFSAIRMVDGLEKPLHGMYTVMQRPERLVDLSKVVANAINDMLAALSGASNANRDLLRNVLSRVLSEKVNDWFRGSQYPVVVGYDRSGNPITQYVNVFLTFNGSPNAGLAIVRVGNNQVFAVPVSFGDTFAPEVNASQKAYPNSLSYVTGPYGSIPVYDSSGNIIEYLPDAYNR